jgi:hypothetical protein
MAKNKGKDDEQKDPAGADVPEAPPPTASATPDDLVVDEAESVPTESVTVTLPPVEPENKDWYYIGLIDKCPSNVVHIAGIDFPKYFDPPREGGDGEQFRHRMRGKLIRLTPKQVAKVKKDVLDQFFQIDPTKVQKKTKKNVYYKPAQDDRSVAFFAFMQRVKNPRQLNRDIMSPTPPTLAKLPEGMPLLPAFFDPNKILNHSAGKPLLNVPEELRQPATA